MPKSAFIFRVRPEDSQPLRYLEKAFGFVEKLFAAQNLNVQFETLSDTILVFWQSAGDIKRTFQLLGEIPLENHPSYAFSNKLISWDVTIIEGIKSEKDELLDFLKEKAGLFLGRFGHVVRQDDTVRIRMPDNFLLDKYFKALDFSQLTQLLKQPAKK